MRPGLAVTIEIECGECEFKRTTAPARLETGADVAVSVILMRHAAETGHRWFDVQVTGDTGYERAAGRPGPHE